VLASLTAEGSPGVLDLGSRQDVGNGGDRGRHLTGSTTMG
jgi:hypothetical protein